MLPSFMAYYYKSLKLCLNGSSCQPDSIQCYPKGCYEQNMLTDLLYQIRGSYRGVAEDTATLKILRKI